MTLQYMTEFMRQVIENGQGFSENHMFIVLLHLEPEQVTSDLCEFMKEMLHEVNVKKQDMDRFMSGLSDADLHTALQEVMPYLY